MSRRGGRGPARQGAAAPGDRAARRRARQLRPARMQIARRDGVPGDRGQRRLRRRVRHRDHARAVARAGLFQLGPRRFGRVGA